MKNSMVTSQSLDDVLIPGVEVEMEPEEAKDLGCFRETALTDEDAASASLEGGTSALTDEEITQMPSEGGKI